MNGKLIILLTLCMNIVLTVFAAGCTADGATCNFNVENPVLDYFFIVDTTQNTGGVEVGNNLSSAVGGVTDAQSTGVQIDNPVFSLLDGLSMIVGFLSLLTPFPLLAFFNGLGTPVIYTIFISVPMFMVWTISLVEIVRGARF